MSSGRGCSQDGAVVGTIMFFHVKHDEGVFPYMPYKNGLS